jgi:lysophospholipase L1-like esterase
MLARWIPLLAATAAGADAEPFAFKDGDRVALVGNTVIERAQEYGHLETLLTLGAGKKVKGVTFRNLGWSGDSVFGDARSYFGPPQEGRDRLQRVIGEVKPSVLMVCYGTNAAMTSTGGWTDDPVGAARSKGGDAASMALFLEGYGKLLDLLTASAGEALRDVILISPPPLENLGAPLPDQSENNGKLGRYRDAIRGLATARGHRFVDLFEAMGGDLVKAGEKTVGPLTTNGVHYGDAGYTVMGEALVKGLGLTLPENLSANATEVVALRETVKKKDRLFFHRWRPVNETYLFLFRKHEQGQNAKEIPMFDPLIETEERKIEELRAKVFEELGAGSEGRGAGSR